jgi:hypothetical protein
MSLRDALRELFGEPPRTKWDLKWGQIADIVLAADDELETVQNERMAQCHDPKDLRAANVEHRLFQLGCEIRADLIRHGWKPPQRTSGPAGSSIHNDWQT